MKMSLGIIHGPLLDHIMLMSGSFFYIIARTKCLYQCFVHSRDFKNDFKTIPSFHKYVTTLCHNSVCGQHLLCAEFCFKHFAYILADLILTTP